MPEGDTVYVTCRRLHEALADEPVLRFELRVPGLALADLTGSTVLEVVPRGKHVLIRFDTGQTLHSHLRMDGSWRVGRTGQRPRGRDFEIRALLGNRAWLAAGFRVHDLALLPTDAEHEVVGHLGPDLLAEDFDAAEAQRRFAAEPGRQIADALLDQRLVAGIGNVYKSELLFLHRVSPFATVAAAAAELPGILTDARRLLRGNLGDFNRSTTGWRQPGQQYWVYGRAGKACRRCRREIWRDEGTAWSHSQPAGAGHRRPGPAPAEEAAVTDERITYYCPSCQGVVRDGGR
ncbi:MAG TPA: DNA-formamidopyrimidine glycosylase family protein [Jatrophihabitans sp.]|nr:DNA-formamidopyrimidine glycosylase family protein [Jatrophihabitans sp.]